MNNFYKIKKLMGVLIVLFCMFTFTGCVKSEGSMLWKRYVKAVNAGDLNKVAETFFIPKIKNRQDKMEDNPQYLQFKKENATYLDGIDNIKTLDYKEIVNCDFSRGGLKKAYYKAKIKIKINKQQESEIEIYSYLNNSGCFFCSPFTLNPISGNEPDENWKKEAYFTNKDYKYKTDQDGNGIYIEKVKNEKEVIIPAEIDGIPIKTIGEKAMFKSRKILCFTISSGRMRKVTIPEGIETIGEHAFYTCKKLKEVVIPASVRLIDKKAFSGCSGLEKLIILSRTKMTNNAPIESESFGEENIKIVGAHNLQAGEITTLKTTGTDKIVTWSTSGDESKEVIEIIPNTGEVKTKRNGIVKVRASLKDDPTNYSEVSIEVVQTPESIVINAEAFDRCKNLKQIYLHAVNPNSIVIKDGTHFNFNKTCDIFVPHGSKKMYINNDLWKEYEDQIKEFPETEEEANLDYALETLESETGPLDDVKVNVYVNPIKTDNIIYLFRYDLNGEKQKTLVDVYSGIINVTGYDEDKKPVVEYKNRKAAVIDISKEEEEKLYQLCLLGTRYFGVITEFEKPSEAGKTSLTEYAALIIKDDWERIEKEIKSSFSDATDEEFSELIKEVKDENGEIKTENIIIDTSGEKIDRIINPEKETNTIDLTMFQIRLKIKRKVKEENTKDEKPKEKNTEDEKPKETEEKWETKNITILQDEEVLLISDINEKGEVNSIVYGQKNIRGEKEALSDLIKIIWSTGPELK